MKEAGKKVQVTEQICRQAQLMRKGGANQMQVAELLGLNGCTVSRIEAAGFDLQTYTENRKARREREKQAKKPKVELVYDASIAEEYRREQEAKKAAEEPVPGQIMMELEEPPKEMVDRTKFMRFEAGQYDLTRKAMAESTMALAKAISDSAVMLNTKLDRLNDTLCMILRAVRKE